MANAFRKIADDLAKGVKSVVDDVSRKWEEFVYGRTVTPRSQNITFDMVGEQSPAERLGWVTPGDHAQRAAGSERDREHANEKAPDRGIDL